MDNIFSRIWFKKSEACVVFSDKKTRRENIAAFIVCLLLSGVFLAICTRSSFLYPLNDWVDSNCFFTVGKSMMNGKVVYRDIYEQKGVLLYFIHGLAYLISNTTFIGVYLFEVIFFTFFLYLSYLCARLYTNYALSLCVLPVISYAVLTSVSLRQGDSAEEFCLPFILLPIYVLLRSVKKGDGSGVPSAKWVFLLGMGAACVLWIKYTLLGVYIGYVLAAVMLCVTDKQPKKLLVSAAAFAGGAAVVSLPFLVYFALNGALGDMFTAYFYNNMFLYSDEKTFTDKLAGIFSLAVRGLSYNGIWGKLAWLGFFSVVLDIRAPRASLGVLLLYLGNIFFIYWGGIGWYYYSFGMVALSVLGFVFVVRLFGYLWNVLKTNLKIIFPRFIGADDNGQAPPEGVGKAASAQLLDSGTVAALSYICAFAVLASMSAVFAEKSYRECDNVFYMEYEREDIWQQKFADIIALSQEQTLLNYSCLDLGLYTTANIVPTEKYFARLNIDLEEMKESLDLAISEQHTEFVVIRGTPSSFVKQYYDIVAQEQSFVEYEGSSTSYYLLQRKK